MTFKFKGNNFLAVPPKAFWEKVSENQATVGKLETDEDGDTQIPFLMHGAIIACITTSKPGTFYGILTN